jgi:guanylate kinase
MQIVEKAREDVVTIFILPPSMAELRSRLVRRAEDAQEVIAKRLANARSEIARWEKYDYVIVNDDLNDAYDSIKAILTAERLKRSRAIGLADFVETLLDEAMP